VGQANKVKERDQNIIQQTIDFWQSYYSQQLTDEDAHEIIENTAGFFKILAEWERKNQEQTGIAGYDPRGAVGNYSQGTSQCQMMETQGVNSVSGIRGNSEEGKGEYVQIPQTKEAL